MQLPFNDHVCHALSGKALGSLTLGLNLAVWCAEMPLQESHGYEGHRIPEQNSTAALHSTNQETQGLAPRRRLHIDI